MEPNNLRLNTRKSNAHSNFFINKVMKRSEKYIESTPQHKVKAVTID